MFARRLLTAAAVALLAASAASAQTTTTQTVSGTPMVMPATVVTQSTPVMMEVTTGRGRRARTTIVPAGYTTPMTTGSMAMPQTMTLTQGTVPMPMPTVTTGTPTITTGTAAVTGTTVVTTPGTTVIQSAPGTVIEEPTTSTGRTRRGLFGRLRR